MHVFRSVPLRPEDYHLTTFVIQWGRYYYKVAPQGYLASRDAYTRLYDEIIIHLERQNAFMTLFYGMRSWLIIKGV